MTELTFHPAADLLPMMSPAEQAALEADIRLNGQREDIVLLNGQILDGRNRYLILRRLNLPVRTVPADPKAARDPIAFVYSKALHRDLSDSQKACAAVAFEARIRDMKETEYTSLRKLFDKRLWELSSHNDRHTTREFAGHLFGISGRLVAYARKLQADAPDLFDRCRSDRDYPLSRGRSDLRRRTDPQPDPTPAEKAMAAIHSAAKRIRDSIGFLFHGDGAEPLALLDTLLSLARAKSAVISDSSPTSDCGTGVSPVIPE